ncbi:MAG: DUF1320 domain-containing protein [Halothiobacillaceae bacterium]|nr:DUF1320 domain-containing protein [Halothiobacillaceae bacterium]
MSYATLADMSVRFGEAALIELTDRTGVGHIDMSVLDEALADAAAEIEGYLTGRYALPVAVVPPLLARIACDIARYRLAAERASEEMRARYEDARKMLHAIADGRVRLGIAPALSAVPGAGGSLEVVTGHRPRDWGVIQ